jgi:hypothetical protein
MKVWTIGDDTKEHIVTGQWPSLYLREHCISASIPGHPAAVIGPPGALPEPAHITDEAFPETKAYLATHDEGIESRMRETCSLGTRLKGDIL